MKRIKRNKTAGITLIALVVTIIILLILAGISIGMLSGDNSIINQAGNAKTQTDIAGEKEILEQATVVAMSKSKYGNVEKQYLDSEINKYSAVDGTEEVDKGIKVTFKSGREYLIDIDGIVTKLEPLPIILAGETAPSNSNATYIDTNGNTAIIPSGFTVSSTENNITSGLVISDSFENEFVWIPLGDIKKSDGTITKIDLQRYKFDTSGNPSVYIEGYEVEEDVNDTENLLNLGNMLAKNINKFITNSNNSGGYYIGRYESRTTKLRSDASEELTEVSINPSNYVYNYITQSQASERSRNMYSENQYFESDLINSYAWDTALLFLQVFDNRNISLYTNYTEKFSRQSKVSSTYSNVGTRIDVNCNVYDMASNCSEWSTETSTSSTTYPCTRRGGNFYYNTTAWRGMKKNDADDTTSFRVILYLK